MRSCPERAYILAFFAPPPPLGDENPVMLHFFAYAEIIFAHILAFPACAIEVEHIDENSPTITLSQNDGGSHVRNTSYWESRAIFVLESKSLALFLSFGTV